MEALAVLLPHGAGDAGGYDRRAAIRPLTGRDEEFLSEEGSRLLPSARVTALLARCLVSLGDRPAVDEAAVRELTVSDRDCLLLQLRRLSLGERLSCVIVCPSTECRQKMDLALDVGDLLRRPGSEDRVLDADVDGAGLTYDVRFRLPTGADQEAGAELAITSPELAAALVLRRCLLRVARDGVELTLDEVPAELAEAVPELMALASPQAEIQLRLSCPECGHNFLTLFDPADFLFRELAVGRSALHREVHALALNYHWSEADILGMSRSRRHLYLDLLAEGE